MNRPVSSGLIATACEHSATLEIGEDMVYVTYQGKTTITRTSLDEYRLDIEGRRVMSTTTDLFGLGITILTVCY